MRSRFPERHTHSMALLSQTTATTYLNPVFPQTFADPFVLKHRGQYWAYCTGLQADGNAFGVLWSHDLVQWQRAGSAMAPLPGAHPCYWAPEVTYDNGRFFLYYSVGNEETMHIRVAVAGKPGGPFIDSGRQLTGEPFAIDPHVFIDDDGRRFLFYATDFYDHSHVGTGTVRDWLVDSYTLAGEPQPVSRARFDWQVYDAQRTEKGGVRWHTVEGPFVLKHKGKYYQMFSGGNWQNPSYGVGYALAKEVDTREEWEQVCDGERVPPILQTVPDIVKGPGHNSVVRGPDNMQQYCVYHRWANGDGRQMAIDALDWAGERMLVMGPSHTAQRAPLQPHFADFLAGQRRERPRGAWRQEGSEWVVRDGAAMAREAGTVAELHYATPAAAFVLEVSVAGAAEATSGAWGVTLRGEGEPLLSFRLLPEERRAVISRQSAQREREQRLALPENFDFTAYHLLRLEVDGARAKLAVDNVLLRWQGELGAEATHVVLCSEQARAAFSGFALTQGWQALFMEDGEPQDGGWQGGGEQWRVRGQRLLYTGEGASRICRGPFWEAYELVVNARLERGGETGYYGFLPALSAGGDGPLLTVEPDGKGWRLVWREVDEASGDGASGDEASTYAMPAAFDAHVYQQFRLRKEQGRLTVSWEGRQIAAAEVNAAPSQIGLYGCERAVAFDLVRVTALSGEQFAQE